MANFTATQLSKGHAELKAAGATDQQARQFLALPQASPAWLTILLGILAKYPGILADLLALFTTAAQPPATSAPSP